jgi:hypothetical protein
MKSAVVRSKPYWAKSLPLVPAGSAVELQCTQQLHALGNRVSLYAVFKLLESLPVISAERYQQLIYLEQLYMRSQPESLPHPQFVLRRYRLVLQLATRHPDYPLFCRWRELISWLNNPLRLQLGCWREFLGKGKPLTPEGVVESVFCYIRGN